MSAPINFSLPKSVELKPRIVVIGVGGAGGNAVNNMIASGLDGVEFVVANTDAQALALSRADRRIQMGGDVTQGLGAGMRPEVGEESAEDSMAEILEQL
ncbi:MAG: cell division protein FtsZ, partial [Robiginitomaculum sp.]